MNSRERVLAALNLEQPDRVPFVDCVDHGIRQRLMGRNDFDEIDLARKLNMDGIYFGEFCAPLFTKPHTRASAGATTSDSEGGWGNYIGEGIIRTEDDLTKIVLPDPRDESFYDPAKKFIDRYGHSDLAIYSIVRPFGLFNILYSMPMTDFAKALYKRRPMVEKMMDIFIEWNIEVLTRLQRLGRLDFFLACNDMAFTSGPMVSPDTFRGLFLPKMKLAAQAINIPWAFHSDGDLALVMDDLLTLGMNAVNPFEPPLMDLKTAKERWGDKICLWGNVDLHYTLTRGTPAEVEAEVKACLAAAAPGGGYICASANSLTDYCLDENVRALVRTLEKYGQYPINLDQ